MAWRTRQRRRGVPAVQCQHCARAARGYRSRKASWDAVRFVQLPVRISAEYGLCHQQGERFSRDEKTPGTDHREIFQVTRMADASTQLPMMPHGEEAILVASIGFRERLLLVIAGLFILVIHGDLILARGISLLDYWHVVIWIVCAMFGHLVLRRYLPHRDPFLFPIVILLAGW